MKERNKKITYITIGIMAVITAIILTIGIFINWKASNYPTKNDTLNIESNIKTIGGIIDNNLDTNITSFYNIGTINEPIYVQPILKSDISILRNGQQVTQTYTICLIIEINDTNNIIYSKTQFAMLYSYKDSTSNNMINNNMYYRILDYTQGTNFSTTNLPGLYPLYYINTKTKASITATPLGNIWTTKINIGSDVQFNTLTNYKKEISYQHTYPNNNIGITLTNEKDTSTGNNDDIQIYTQVLYMENDTLIQNITITTEVNQYVINPPQTESSRINVWEEQIYSVKTPIIKDKKYTEQEYQNAIKNTYDETYNIAYAKGYDKAKEENGSIWNMLLTVGEVPINFIQDFLDFEILGVDMSKFVMVVLTACLVGVIFKLFI